MELRQYQKDAVDATWDWFRTNPSGAPVIVIPTGGGKSVIIAELAKKIAERGSDRRVLVLAHRAELLEQSIEKLRTMWPFGKTGLYSAGLGKRDTDSQVLFAGIQSVYNKATEIGQFSLVILDECHLLPASGEGRYRTLIDDMLRLNPRTRFLGLSATPYRMGSGVVFGADRLFTDVAYEIGIKELTEAGYLSPLVGKAGKSKPNLSLIGTRGGEFVADEMERAFNRLDVVEAALEEICTYGADRKKWLIFASGVKHAEEIHRILTRVGIPCGVVTGDTPPLMRRGIFDDFSQGRLRALIGCEVFTTGYDEPGIDLIALLRATKSTALYVQMLGRGCRKAEGKLDCKVLDFGENIARHGKLDQIRIARRYNPVTEKTDAEIETIAAKECPNCGEILRFGDTECVDCGFVYPVVIRHGAEASNDSVMSEPEKPHIVDVVATKYVRHVPKDKPTPSMRVDYVLSMIENYPVKKVSEWVCFEHRGMARDKASKWWLSRGIGHSPVPLAVEDALARLSEIRSPKKIEIQKDGKWWRVLSVVEWREEDAGAEEKARIDEEERMFLETGLNF